ncbi:MAG: TIGR04255 family protein [Leptolyngbya sp. Prado105]|jgi:uncharacterized protein (TIGR04255 family)|nr:TIGR04255 family protein [Leptolyngbya sp. Prado105]
MQERRYYSKAPITEALIDLRVSLPSEATLAELNHLFSLINAEYPNQEAQLFVQSQVTAGASVGATANQTQVGYVYSTSDRKQAFSACLDGFTFSRLAPYDRWEIFRDEAKRLWSIYQDAVQPTAINRLAVRYINRLDIPLPISDLKDFLRTFPEVSADLPEGLSGYFMQLQIPQEDIGAMVVINQAMIPSSTPEVLSVLLDIDVFQDYSSLRDNSFWDYLEKLHTKVDKVFEACITDETRELISQ